MGSTACPAEGAHGRMNGGCAPGNGCSVDSNINNDLKTGTDTTETFSCYLYWRCEIGRKRPKGGVSCNAISVLPLHTRR